jgi:hypothetical protein
MKKITNASSLSLFMLLALTSMLFFSSCAGNKQYFSFAPAPPAYVKKQTPAAVTTTPAATDNAEADNTILSANSAPEQAMVLPEIAALTATKAASVSATAEAQKATVAAKPAQKLSLAQKVVLHKIQKQAKKLSKQDQQAKNAAAGPVSNRNSIALILIGLIVTLFGSLLGIGIFYTLGVLILLVGLVLLILNYV